MFSGSDDNSVKQWAADSGEVGPPPFRSVGGGGQLCVSVFVSLFFLFFLFFLFAFCSLFLFSLWFQSALVFGCCGGSLHVGACARVCACASVCVCVRVCACVCVCVRV